LGAKPAGVVRLILRSGRRVALIGAGLGVLGAGALSRLVSTFMPSLQTNGGLVLGVGLPSCSSWSRWRPGGCRRARPLALIRW
jgi:hypothetical protein